MRDIFEGIQYFFEEILFAPFSYLANLELDSWFLANILNWIFILIGFAALIYWVKQLKKFSDNKEDQQDTTAHSFLG